MTPELQAPMVCMLAATGTTCCTRHLHFALPLACLTSPTKHRHLHNSGGACVIVCLLGAAACPCAWEKALQTKQVTYFWRCCFAAHAACDRMVHSGSGTSLIGKPGGSPPCSMCISHAQKTSFWAAFSKPHFNQLHDLLGLPR